MPFAKPRDCVVWGGISTEEKRFEAVDVDTSLTPNHLNHQKAMEAANASAEGLKRQIAATEIQLQKLKDDLAKVEASDAAQKLNSLSLSGSPVTQLNGSGKWPLSQEEYKRYGRQMIVPSIGIQGLYLLSFCKLPSADQCRPTSSQIVISLDHRSRRPRMPSCCVYCWSRRGKDRDCRWGYG